jgi:hypothetical protein
MSEKDTKNGEVGNGSITSPPAGNEYELGEWAASAVQEEPTKIRSRCRLIAVLAGLNVRMTSGSIGFISAFF